MIRLVFCLCSIVNLDSHIEEDFLNYKNQEWHKTNIDTKLCNGYTFVLTQVIPTVLIR